MAADLIVQRIQGNLILVTFRVVLLLLLLLLMVLMMLQMVVEI